MRNYYHEMLLSTAELAPGATTGKTWIFIIHAANDYCYLLYVFDVNLSLSFILLPDVSKALPIL